MKYQNIVVMGAGAVGGFFGALLDQHPETDLTYIARGSHLKAIQSGGLYISSINGDVVSHASATDDVQALSPADLILFTVKSYDTDDAIAQIKPIVGPKSQILSIQNGLDNHEKLEEAFGKEHVIRGLCVIGAELIEPGLIEHRALGSISVGERDGRTNTERLKALEALFDAIPAELEISDDIHAKIWKKFAWNCVFNVITGLSQVTVEKLFSTGASRQLIDDVYHEVAEVAAREEVTFTDRDYEQIISGGKKMQGFRTSTFQDVQKGKPLEYEGLTGSLIRRANRYGIEVPVNNTLYALFQLQNM